MLVGVGLEKGEIDIVAHRSRTGWESPRRPANRLALLTPEGNFLEVNPHCFGAVPRVYEKVLARIQDKAQAGSPIKRKLFAWAVNARPDQGPGRRRRGRPLACPLPPAAPVGSS